MPVTTSTPTRASVFFAFLSLGLSIGLCSWGEPFPEGWGVIESTEEAPPAEGIRVEDLALWSSLATGGLALIMFGIGVFRCRQAEPSQRRPRILGLSLTAVLLLATSWFVVTWVMKGLTEY